MDAIRSVFWLIIVMNLVNSWLGTSAHKQPPNKDIIFYNTRTNYFDYLHQKHNGHHSQLGDLLVEPLLPPDVLSSRHRHPPPPPSPPHHHHHNHFTPQLVDPTAANIFNLIDKVTHIGVRNKCDSRMVQSDVMSKMRLLKSVLSTCNGYCRMAMSQDGLVYGSKHFGLETIWNKVDISSDDLARNKYIIGSYYIKFVLANKFLCITKSGDLFASSEQVRGCLWFNQAPRLMSASYRNTNLVITANCKIGVEKGVVHSSPLTSITNSGSCSDNSINITSGFSYELQSFFRTCQAQLIKPSEPSLSQPINKFKSSSFKTAMAMSNNKKIVEQPAAAVVLVNDNSVFTATTVPPLSATVTQKKSLPSSRKTSTSQMRKCFKLKNQPVEYKKCLSKYYKCIKFSSDPEKLRQCRSRNGISVTRHTAESTTS